METDCISLRRFSFPHVLLISIFRTVIVLIVAGEASEITINLLRVMIWVPFIVFFNVPFFQTLLAYDFNKDVMRVLLRVFSW